uniref:Homeobox domain-containing protein n=1 Tax=Panagrolaimus sp. ES5 TaxID=591445 RepID=A0AC34FZF0_9BILA
MATAATQLQITIITPQWLDHPDINEKENKSLQQQQHEQNDTIEETTNLITTTEDKTIKSQKIEPIHEWQKQKFDEWLTKNSFNMYPSRDEKEKLAEMLSASYLQITRLFANQRRRIHKKGKITTIKENDNLSILSPTTTIPENEEYSKINDITSEEINESSIEQMHIEISNVTTSSSERSISPPASSTSFSTFEDNNIAAICSAVADQIHVEQENKKCFEKPILKKKSRKRKNKKISCDEKLLETTVDEILQKIARQDSEGKERKNEKELPPKRNAEVEIEIEMDNVEKSSKGL